MSISKHHLEFTNLADAADVAQVGLVQVGLARIGALLLAAPRVRTIGFTGLGS